MVCEVKEAWGSAGCGEMMGTGLERGWRRGWRKEGRNIYDREGGIGHVVVKGVVGRS